MKKLDKDELYRIAIDTRNMEIKLYWQRSNYFLVLNTAIAVGFFSEKARDYGVPLSILGMVASYLWLKVNFGGKYWQSRWEQRASDLEKDICDNIQLFNTTRDDTNNDVRKSLNRNDSKSDETIFGKAILRKPSVSKMMTWLSISFIGFWAFLFCANSYLMAYRLVINIISAFVLSLEYQGYYGI